MKINFRQGLISYQQSGAQAVFLLAGTVANTITLSVAPQPTIATIAHGSTDYLLKFDQTVLNAWQLSSGVDNWLFIDQNLITGALSYDVTTHEPITSSVEPIGAPTGQLWFDLTETVMKTFNGSKWIDTPRLVVGKIVGGSTNQIQSYPTGSSVGLFVSGSPGFLMLDSQLRPLRTSSGELLTSDTPVRIKTTVGTSGVLSEPVNSFIPIRANEPIPAMSLVYFSGSDAVSLASSNPALVIFKTPVGIVEHALAMNEVGTITQQGEITYDQWDWTEAQIGKPLFCGFNGQLTTVRPLGVQVYRVGFIKNAKTILFYIDSETQPQIVSSPGAIISGTPPLSAVTALNGSGEIVTAISMHLADATHDGYMSLAQASQLGSFDDRITTNTSDIALLQTSKANTIHSHVIADVTGLQISIDALTTSIAGKVPKIVGTTGNFPSINSDGTLLDSSYAYSSFAVFNHVHTVADVTNLQTMLNDKANIVHTHIIADVIDLQTNLDARAFINHTHVIGDVSGLQTSLNNRANLVHTHEIIDINNLQGQLDLRSMVGHSHVISDITNLSTTLNNKANTIHTHVIADTIGLQAAIDSKANTVHTHIATDIINFSEAVQDVVGSTIIAGSGITIVYNDSSNELVISTNSLASTQLKIRNNAGSVYSEYEPTVALAFPNFKVSQISSGLISVAASKLSMFQGLTPLASYPNADVNVETRIVFGMGLQATSDGETVTIQTTPTSGGGSASLPNTFIARVYRENDGIFGGTLFGAWQQAEVDKYSADISSSFNSNDANTVMYTFNTDGVYRISIIGRAKPSNGWSSDTTVYGTKLVLPNFSLANSFNRSQYTRADDGFPVFDGDYGSANEQTWSDTFTLTFTAGQTMNVALYAATYIMDPSNPIDYSYQIAITRIQTA